MFTATIATLCMMTHAPDATPKVEIVAHRGASYDAPENTVAALRLAWDQKADGSEFDIYLTKDGKLAVIHDKDTKRTAGVSKSVADSTFDELHALDVGSWKGAKFKGEPLPSLGDMLAVVPDGKRVFVEVKCGPEAVPELVRALTASKLLPEQTPVIAFDAAVVAALKKARPEVPAYWLVSLAPRKGAKAPTAAEVIAKAKEIKADGVDLSASAALDEAFAKAVREAGLKLYVWTVNDVEVAKRMVRLGVDGITTDRPGWLREQLAK
ncbi:glycerophosphodiester phosphodiesterase [Gemmata sp. JC673]|uniref:Glycerophosphodiester phosphodiesterase n=1 Tax=Gemmata algarum TaxID=2975278 RepID=A0ABU5ESH2_9BACT|nr:glycerophosphodiester phosphodiesterase [Gemmata algarum]MDY3558291.1 glycerophosphodiester phosphodiesterase [Gemmata algarum]